MINLHRDKNNSATLEIENHYLQVNITILAFKLELFGSRRIITAATEGLAILHKWRQTNQFHCNVELAKYIKDIVNRCVSFLSWMQQNQLAAILQAM